MKRSTPQEILMNFINKLKERFNAIKEQNASLLVVLNKTQLELTKIDRKVITDELMSIIAGIENIFQKQESALTKTTRNQLLKLEIEIKLAYLQRVFFDSDLKDAVFQTEPCLGMMVSLFTRFLSAKPWFDCKGDEQCQRDLFRLYTFLSITQQDKVPICGTLIALKDKCDANFIHVTTLFFLMIESISFGFKSFANAVVRMRDLIAIFERPFEQTFEKYSAHQTSLGKTASLRDRLELAVAHFNAYRYLLMCFDINNKRKKASPLQFGKLGRPLAGYIVLVPGISMETEKNEILRLVKKEQELRTAHLIPALKLFPSERLSEIIRNRDLTMLSLFLLPGGFEHLLLWRDMLVDVLKNQAQGHFSIKEKKLLADYTAGLTTEINEWNRQADLLTKNTTDDLQKTSDDPTDQMKIDHFIDDKKALDAMLKKKTDAATRVVQQEIEKFEALEKIAETAEKELLAWDKARKERYNEIRQKRDAALAAQQGSPYIPSSHEPTEKEDEEEAPVVVSLATLKSDNLKRLEFHDAKLSECLERLMSETRFITRVLKNKLSDKKPIPFETMDLLKIKLNATLSDFDLLKSMRQRFSNLASSLSQAELNELNAGITESLLKSKEMEAYFQTTLASTSELLTLVKEKRETQKKEFIEGLGVKMGEAMHPDEELTPERCYELGYAEFVRRGRENANRGLGLSDEALELQYLKNAQAVYAKKFQTITEKAPTKEEDDKPIIYVSYPDRIQLKWELLRGIPGDQFLFGTALIDLLRNDSRSSSLGLPSTVDFSLTCHTIGEVLDAQNRFHVSKFNAKQGRLNLSNYETVNVFLTRESIFTCDGVFGDENGQVHELIEGGLEDIKTGTLRTVQDAALTLREHPQAVLTAVFRMSKGFTPDSALYNALFDWQPTEDLNVDYVKAIVAEQLKQLSPEEREEYASHWNALDLFQKIFKKKLALRELERLALPPKLSSTLFESATKPQTAAQAVITVDEDRKVALR